MTITSSGSLPVLVVTTVTNGNRILTIDANDAWALHGSPASRSMGTSNQGVPAAASSAIVRLPMTSVGSPA